MSLKKKLSTLSKCREASAKKMAKASKAINERAARVQSVDIAVKQWFAIQDNTGWTAEEKKSRQMALIENFTRKIASHKKETFHPLPASKYSSSQLLANAYAKHHPSSSRYLRQLSDIITYNGGEPFPFEDLPRAPTGSSKAAVRCRDDPSCSHLQMHLSDPYRR